ncbi:MAG TPA: hypothetical protein VIJ79_13090 [Acidobacteriaceae bacterium]
MALADDLLSQAHALAIFDPDIPTQANLRRSISSSYYAVFHLLISESVQLLVPAQPRGLASRVGRAFAHADMSKVCKQVSQRPLPDVFVPLLNKGISEQLRSVAETFSTLQQARHVADYDISAVFLREDALSIVADARFVFTDWNLIRNTEEANVFLTALAFGARWAK